MKNNSELKVFHCSSDQDYLTALQSNHVMEHLKKLWNIFHDYADKDFEKKLSEDYWSRVWEMSLGAILQLQNNLIKNNKIEGPDFELYLNGKRIFIEAVCPSPGAFFNPDSVRENNILFNENGNFSIIFEKIEFDKIELRLSSVIHSKTLKLQEYLEKGIVNDDDIYIIAISATKIQNTNFNFGYDMGIELNMLRTILPIGSEIFSIDDLNKGEIKPRFEYKKNNIKSNSKKIDKNIFLDSKYKKISAVIYSSQEYPFAENWGNRNVYIIKNPNGQNQFNGNLGLKEIEIQINENYCKFKKVNY